MDSTKQLAIKARIEASLTKAFKNNAKKITARYIYDSGYDHLFTLGWHGQIIRHKIINKVSADNYIMFILENRGPVTFRQHSTSSVSADKISGINSVVNQIYFTDPVEMTKVTYAAEIGNHKRRIKFATAALKDLEDQLESLKQKSADQADEHLREDIIKLIVESLTNNNDKLSN